jgi:hypothetical protein
MQAMNCLTQDPTQAPGGFKTGVLLALVLAGFLVEAAAERFVAMVFDSLSM